MDLGPGVVDGGAEAGMGVGSGSDFLTGVAGGAGADAEIGAGGAEELVRLDFAWVPLILNLARAARGVSSSPLEPLDTGDMGSSAPSRPPDPYVIGVWGSDAE